MVRLARSTPPDRGFRSHLSTCATVFMGCTVGSVSSCPCCIRLASLLPVSNAKAISISWVYARVADSQINRFCSLLSHTASKSRSQSISFKIVLYAQSSAFLRITALNSEIVLPGFCFLALTQVH